MGTYHQLTEYQRYQMYALKKAGHSQQSIAATVSVSPSTICRELQRNRGQRGYRPHQAHQQALARRCHKAKATKMTPAVIERIEADLRQQWSPEQIAGRLAVTDGLRLSAERIYQHIRADRQAGGTLSLDAAVYFAHPYHAWERGLNENTNGLIRQYVPKGTALDTLSEAQIHHIRDRLNHRPRKGLAFQTPHEILAQETRGQPKQGEIALTS